ncbi:hypothetical protein M1116_01620 [Patescibacteria group bacterium]|nr:hypothetical protein [Patescibacteria group bacterium]
MSTNDIEQGLTHGLLAGYGGQTESAKITRGSFPLRSSHLEESGLTYHDEWLRARTGGGQEIVRVGEQGYTRLYAGGVLPEEELSKLSLDEKAVISQLKAFIIDLGSQTRLFQDCHPDARADWRYDYHVHETDPHLPVTIAKETISFRGQVVFVHDFLLCPVTW